MLINYSMQIEVIIDGMVSVHAKHAVFAALAGVPGVARAEVELGRVVLEVEGDLSAVEPALRVVVAAAGFSVRELKVLGRRLPLL